MSMSFRLVSKSVTLNDFERRNGPYFTLYHRTWQIRGALHKVVEEDIPEL